MTPKIVHQQTYDRGQKKGIEGEETKFYRGKGTGGLATMQKARGFKSGKRG